MHLDQIILNFILPTIFIHNINKIKLYYYLRKTVLIIKINNFLKKELKYFLK
jgi:hypothetical protein